MFYKKAVHKNFAIFPEKIPGSESLFNKVKGLPACNFIKKRLQDRCFPVNTAKFLRTPILKNICEWLLLGCKRFSWRCSAKELLRKISQNLKGKTCVWFPFAIKELAVGLQFYERGTLIQVFSCFFLRNFSGHFFDKIFFENNFAGI